MLSLADAATRALTVDPGLGDVAKLIGLADDVRKVPAARLVFATMPTAPDPFDRARVVPGPAAGRVFAAVAADLPPRPAPARGTPRAASRVDESFAGGPALGGPTRLRARRMRRGGHGRHGQVRGRGDEPGGRFRGDPEDPGVGAVTAGRARGTAQPQNASASAVPVNAAPSPAARVPTTLATA